MTTAVMEHLPPVPIDDGELTVLQYLAAYTWGSWDVTWPEGYDAPELDHDRSLGFVSKLPGPEVGRFSRRFVRADAQIDAENGFTNVEQILDDAAERTEGDVFFQRDISQAELGRLVPGYHFRIGDLLPIRVWGGIMWLPVTAIDEVSEGGVVTGYSVHVGGQLVSDRGELEAQAADTERQIARERRERARQVKAANEAAGRAQRKADGINLDLTGAYDGSIWDSLSTGSGALGSLNTGISSVDDKVDGLADDMNDFDRTLSDVDRLVTNQIGTNGTIRNNVTSMNNIINGTSRPTTNGNLWNMNVNTWDFQGKFNEAQTAINKWVADSIAVLDNRIPVVLSLNKTSQSGVGRIYQSGDRYYFQKYFSANCRILWVVALEAFDSYAYTMSTEMTGGYNQTAYVSPGLLQNITSVTVTVYRQDRMPTINLPSNINRGLNPRYNWHT